LGNYINSLTNEKKSELWKNHGFSIIYKGSGDAGLSKPLNGILSNSLSFSTGANLENAAGTGLATQASKGIASGVSNYIKKVPIVGEAMSEVAKSMAHQAIGESLSQSIKVYQSGNGRPSISLQSIFIPGLFGLSDYNYLEKFALYSTLPKNVMGVAGIASQHLYSPGKTKVGDLIDLSTDLFALKINGIVSITGGMYITEFSRNYSTDKDENGIPIYCEVSITMEYFREMFAEEFIKIFKFGS
jgi:hypothetical protein